MLVPPHPYCLWRTGFFFDAKRMEYSKHISHPFHTPLSEWTSIYLMSCFGRHEASANTLAFLPNAFRHNFILIEVATLTTNDNRDCIRNRSCLHLLLSFRSDILKRYSMYHNLFIRPSVPLQVLSIFPLQS